jgi:predicted metalloprotease with PDZ domain
MGPSDHASFYLQDIPVLHFFTGQHTDYHKPEDDAERINYDGIISITDYMLALITRLDNFGKLAFTKTIDEAQGQRASSFKVSLGVMPDYVFDGEGMRIDGVTEGKPAQKAGLIKGDVIIGLGDVAVKNIQDYMGALGKLNPGEQTRVKILRGQDTLSLPIQL